MKPNLWWLTSQEKEIIEFDDVDMSRNSEGAGKATSDLEGAIAIPLSKSDTNDLQGPKEMQCLVVIEEDLEKKAMREEAELLQYHYRYAHDKLQIMARQRIIPKRLAKCWQPVCVACMYGKAVKWQQWHKSLHNKDKSVTQTRPG